MSQPIKRSCKQQQRADRLASSITLYDHSTSLNSIRIRQYIKILNIAITVKNLKRCHAYEKELLTGTGSVIVPCLKVESEKGSRWIQGYEAVKDYLDQKFIPKPKIQVLDKAL